MRHVWLRAAFREAVEAIAYADLASSEGGKRLRSALDATVQRALRYPESGAPAGYAARALLVRGTRLRLVYRVRADHIRIVAIAHTSRKPGYWRSRR